MLFRRGWALALARLVPLQLTLSCVTCLSIAAGTRPNAPPAAAAVAPVTAPPAPADTPDRPRSPRCVRPPAPTPPLPGPLSAAHAVIALLRDDGDGTAARSPSTAAEAANTAALDGRILRQPGAANSLGQVSGPRQARLRNVLVGTSVCVSIAPTPISARLPTPVIAVRSPSRRAAPCRVADDARQIARYSCLPPVQQPQCFTPSPRIVAGDGYWLLTAPTSSPCR